MITCPRCGEDNPERFRLCGVCGTPLPAAAPAEEVRKTVTVLFCDIVGSTALAERIDPESLRHAMTRYFAEMRAVLERHGGTVEKFIGDAIMAVFGIPAVHEDDALRAVQAAVEMRDALALLNHRLQAEWGVTIATRTGVNTGEVVAGDSGEGQAFVSGDAVNVAARLEQHAEPGEILVGATTWQLVRHAADGDAVEPMALKGKAEAVPAWRVASISRFAQVGDRGLRSPIVGRDREMEGLRAAFARATGEGRGHLVTVLGMAGVGKSRLVREFVDGIGRSAAVLQGRCLHYGEGITFWPIAEMVRQAAGLTGREAAHETRAKLAGIVPPSDEAAMVAERTAAVIGLADTSGAIEETFWSIRRVLETVGGAGPLVAVVEDIHWAEPTLLDLLEYLVNFVGDRPVLLVCTARPDLLDSRPSWGSTRDRSSLVALEPLDDRASEELVHNLLQAALLPEELRGRIVGTAEGNPLFVEEFLRMLIDDGRLRRANAHWALVGDTLDLAVPPTIRALLAARLDRLEPAERAVIQRASVVGKVFYWGAVSGLSPDQERQGVGRHLQTLVRKELIRPDPGSFAGEDAFRFGHILVRDAAYDAIPKRARAALHERFATWLEQRASGRGGGLEEILGYHLEQARNYLAELGPDDDHARGLARRAAGHLARAGRAAFGRGDYRAVDNLLSRAMVLLPESDPDRLELALPLIDSLWPLGEQARMEALVGETGTRVSPGSALARRIHIRQLFVRVMTDPGIDFDQIAPVAKDQAIALEGLGDEPGQAEAWFMFGRMCFDVGKLSEAREALERVVALADATGHRYQTARALTVLVWSIDEGLTPVAEAIDRLKQLRQRAGGDRGVEAAVDMSTAFHHALAGRHDEARLLIGSADSMLEDLGARFLLATFVSTAAGRIFHLAGDLEAAEARVRQAYLELEQMGNTGFLSSRAAFLAFILPELGRDAEALEFADIAERTAAKDDLEPQIWLREARAKVLSHRGQHGEAERMAREAVAMIAATEWGLRHADALVTLGDVQTVAGRADAAVDAFREAIELYDRKGATLPAQQARARLAEL